MRITLTAPRVYWTITGASALGTTWWRITRRLLHPMDWAASMYSRSFNVRTWALIMRANSGDWVTISAIIIFSMLLPRAATMLTHMSMVGMPMKMSTMRMTMLSSLG